MRGHHSGNVRVVARGEVARSAKVDPGRKAQIQKLEGGGRWVNTYQFKEPCRGLLIGQSTIFLVPHCPLSADLFDGSLHNPEPPVVAAEVGMCVVGGQ